MTLVATPVGSGKLYLPVKSYQTGEFVFVYDVSIYDISQAIYSASYAVFNNSNQYSITSFVAYPQAVITEVPTSEFSFNFIMYETENVIDDTYFSMVPPLLAKFYEQQLSYEQVGTFPYISSIKLVYYQGDVLFLIAIPVGVVVYSVKTQKFYNIRIPNQLLGFSAIYSDYTFLSGLIIGILAIPIGDTINVNIIQAQFTYSETVLTPVYTTTINVGTSAFDLSANIVANATYAITVIRYSYPSGVSGVSTAQIAYYIYDIINNTVTSFNSGQLNGYSLVNSSSSLSSTTGKVVSIYAYYVFTELFNETNNSVTIFSLNLKTLSFENVSIPVNPNSFGAFLQGNYLILLGSVHPPFQQGYLYFIPVDYTLYQLSASDMIIVQFYELVLEKNILIISGKAYNLQTGLPVANATVGIYYANSVLGNQIGVGKLIGTTTTNADGEFQFSTTLSQAIPDADIVVTVSTDPIIIQYITIKRPVTPTQYYY